MDATDAASTINRGLVSQMNRFENQPTAPDITEKEAVQTAKPKPEEQRSYRWSGYAFPEIEGHTPRGSPTTSPSATPLSTFHDSTTDTTDAGTVLAHHLSLGYSLVYLPRFHH